MVGLPQHQCIASPPLQMPTRTILQYAANLNSEGASFLSTNNGFAAFEYFRSALEVVVMGTPQANQVLSGCPAAKLAKSLLLQPRMFHCLLWSDRSSPSQTRNSSDPHIFRKAFVFHPRDDEREPALQIRTCLAMLLFNLATTIHQRGTSMQRHMDQALNIALELYDVAFDILLQEECCCLDDWSNNISLAILNNMAEVHWTLSDYNKVTRVLELQKGLLDIIISSKRPTNFSEQEMETFILNTQLLQAPAGAAAA